MKQFFTSFASAMIAVSAWAGNIDNSVCLSDLQFSTAGKSVPSQAANSESIGTVSAFDVWNMANFVSTRTNGKTELVDGILQVTSGTDNLKRGDIRNTTDVIQLGNNKVVFYEVSCTSAGVSLNENDMKVGYTATVPSFGSTAVVNEQLLKSGAIDLANGHKLVYFDLSEKNANVAYYAGDAGNRFDTATKDSYRSQLSASTSVDISAVNFTLIGSGATNFSLYKMGSARDVNTLKIQYGLVEQPAITIAESGIGYETLDAAIAAVAPNAAATLVVNKDITLGSRLNIKDKNITIKGATGNERIVRNSGYTGLLFLTVTPSDNTENTTYASILTLENITVDGAAVECSGSTAEASNRGFMNFHNVTFINCINSTGTQGIISNKSNGVLLLDGVTMTNCSAVSSKALVFVGTNNTTLSGTNNFGAVFVELQNYITNEQADGVQHIIVSDTRTEGLLVKNATVSAYTVTGTDLQVRQDGDNVVLVAVGTGIEQLKSNQVVATRKILVDGRIIIVKHDKKWYIDGRRAE